MGHHEHVSSMTGKKRPATAVAAAHEIKERDALPKSFHHSYVRRYHLPRCSKESRAAMLRAMEARGLDPEARSAEHEEIFETYRDVLVDDADGTVTTISGVDYASAGRKAKASRKTGPKKPTFEPGVDVFVLDVEPRDSETGLEVKSFFETGDGSVDGLEFCFTGFRDDTLKRKIEEAGGKVSTSLRPQSTGVLVSKLGGKPGKKSDQARANGIPIVVISGGTKPRTDGYG